MPKNKSNKQNGKSENKLNPAILKSAIDMVKSVSDLTKTAIDAGDAEKYARSVNELNIGVSDTYAEMRNLILNDSSLSTDEKLQKLDELAKKESESKAKCDEAIKGNREHIAQLTMDIFAGLLTCGISFTPAIIKKFKSINDKSCDNKKLVDTTTSQLPENTDI